MWKKKEINRRNDDFQTFIARIVNEKVTIVREFIIFFSTVRLAFLWHVELIYLIIKYAVDVVGGERKSFFLLARFRGGGDRAKKSRQGGCVRSLSI